MNEKTGVLIALASSALGGGAAVATRFLIGHYDSLLLAGVRFGDKYTLYSLRHFYATMALNKNVPIYAVARNMGTSVKIIESYYGKAFNLR